MVEMHVHSPIFPGQVIEKRIRLLTVKNINKMHNYRKIFEYINTSKNQKVFNYKN